MKVGSYFTENTLHLRYKCQWVYDVQEEIGVYSEEERNATWKYVGRNIALFTSERAVNIITIAESRLHRRLYTECPEPAGYEAELCRPFVGKAAYCVTLFRLIGIAASQPANKLN